MVFVSARDLEHNLRGLMAVVGGRAAFPVIKANAYGHDAAQVAALLAGRFSIGDVPMFCVARSAELVPLLALPVDQDFLILSHFDWEWHLDHPHHEGVVWSLTSREDLEKWRSRARDLPQLSRVHLKINTGMNRLGVSLTQLTAMLPFLKTCVSEGLQLEGIFTHFWNADGDTATDTEAQVAQFATAVKLLSDAGLVHSFTWIHAENSAALRWHLAMPRVGRLAFRPGIHLWGYGINEDYLQRDEVALSLRPALAVAAPLRQVREIQRGEGLSYGWAYCNQQDSLWVATVPLGYADGIPRAMSWDGDGSPRGYLIVEGKRCPIISTVTMDMVMIALETSLVSKLQTDGDAVVAYWIHPEHQSVSKVAGFTNMITYEVLCRLSARLPRRFVDSWEELP